MALPTQPTATTICTEAWKLFGKNSPTTADITRATDYGIEMVKSDIKDMGLEWSFLRKTAYITLMANVSKVQLPTDFARLLSVQILKGDLAGSAVGGGTSEITLASTFSKSESDTEGKWIVLTEGVGSGQARQISNYTPATKLVSVDESWTTAPTSASVYMIVDNHYPCDYKPEWELSEIELPHLEGRPTVAYHTQDDAEGDLHFNYAPDSDYTYVAKVVYYADIQKIDLTATLYNTILRLLNGLFIQGVFVWTLQDDTRYQIELQKYRDKLQRAAGLYLYPNQIPDNGCRLDYK
jgi:hypothetical protein